MELEDYYENANNRHFMNTTGPQRHSQDEGKARNHSKQNIKFGFMKRKLLDFILSMIKVLRNKVSLVSNK